MASNAAECAAPNGRQPLALVVDSQRHWRLPPVGERESLDGIRTPYEN